MSTSTATSTGSASSPSKNYFTIVSPRLPDSDKVNKATGKSRNSSGLFHSDSRDTAAGKAATKVYNSIFKQQGKMVFVFHIARNKDKDRGYPYVAIIEKIDKVISRGEGSDKTNIRFTLGRRVYSLAGKQVHHEVKRLLDPSVVAYDSEGKRLPPLPAAGEDVKSRIRSIMQERGATFRAPAAAAAGSSR
ncbi:hypothetical protein HXX76_014155 [Chlamydomonas incerta]|uniref:Uncharacterized protein n=1 Tax=Chlamydomonas incerta TaxID=51695 RepID=A0A835SHJ6_CHLIN|nr:hypothetical protein HXX76_014155 [Chlamydomonas incerta]|eukprot:KAG2424997.1 hypothetical protein HXX76_014155 [Chlamydomonas incerta]